MLISAMPAFLEMLLQEYLMLAPTQTKDCQNLHTASFKAQITPDQKWLGLLTSWALRCIYQSKSGKERASSAMTDFTKGEFGI